MFADSLPEWIHLLQVIILLGIALSILVYGLASRKIRKRNLKKLVIVAALAPTFSISQLTPHSDGTYFINTYDAPQQPLRVTITMVGDEEFYSTICWTHTGQYNIEFWVFPTVKNIFHYYTEVTLEITQWSSYNSDDTLVGYDRFYEVSDEVTFTTNILVAWTSQPIGNGYYGFGSDISNIILIEFPIILPFQIPSPMTLGVQIFLHELGHVYGLDHCVEQWCIMNPQMVGWCSNYQQQCLTKLQTLKHKFQ